MEVEVFAQLTIQKYVRDTNEGREDVTMKSVRDDEASRSEQLEAGDGLGPGTLVLASLWNKVSCAFDVVVQQCLVGVIALDICSRWAIDARCIGEFPVDFVVCYVADGAAEVEVAFTERYSR